MNSPYKNSRYSSYNQTGKSMLQFLRSNIFQQKIGGSDMALSLCQKLNESGNGYNERLLVLIMPGAYLAYGREFKATNVLPMLSERDFPPIKRRILLESIVEHWAQDDTLKIKFREADSMQAKTWCFRMSSPNMTYLWDNRILDARTKSLQIHNKPDIETENTSRRTSQLRISSTLNQQITPSKQAQLSIIFEKSLSDPFTVHPQQSQVVGNPLQVSNVLPEIPIDSRNDQEQEIWVFPEFKESKQEPFKKNKSFQSIHLQPQSKDNSLLQQDSALRKPIDERVQLEKFLNCEWSYEFLQSDESELIPLFEEFSERLVMGLVDQMILPVNFQTHHPRYKDKGYFEYVFQFVTVKITFSVPTLEGVYNESTKLKLKHEFRNMDYIIGCLGNEQLIRVPLCALVDYKGSCSLVTANIKTVQAKPNLKAIGEHLNKLSARAKIKPTIFSDKDSLVIAQADMDYYNKLAKQNGDSSFKGVLYFLTDVNNFLPEDTFFDQSMQPNSVTQQVRPEFLSRMTSPVQGRMLSASMNPTEYKQIRRELDQLSSNVLNRIDQAVEQINQSPTSIIIPNDLTQLLHSKGLSMRYLGLLYQNIIDPKQKRIVMSDIISRSLQSVVKGRLCSETLIQTISLISKQLDLQKYLYDKNTQLVGKLMDMIMRMLTEQSQEMDTVWEEIDRIAVSKFNKCIDRQEIQLPYFYFAVLRGSSLKVNWQQVSTDFRPDNIGRGRLFDGFAVETRVYNISFTDKAQNLSRLLNRPDNVKQVRDLLGLENNETMPPWVFKAGLHKTIVKYHQANKILNQKHLGLLEGQLLGCFELNFLLSQVRMELQQGNIAKADEIRNRLFKEIERSVGSQIHPFVSLVFEAYSEYFQKHNKLEQALLKVKNSLIIRIKYSGSKSHQHQKIYQRIADLLVKLDRKAEAIDYYRRIKLNLQKNTQQWVDTVIKQASLQRSLRRLNVIESDLTDAFEYIKSQRPLDEQRLLLISNLLNQCFTTPLQAEKLSNFIGKLEMVSIDIEQSQYLEGIFKHIVRQYLGKIAQPTISSFLILIKDLTAKQAKNYNYGYSVKIIKQRLTTNKVWNNLKEYINSMDKLLIYIDENQLLLNWKGFLYAPNNIFEDFLVIISILLYFLGQDFIESIFAAQTN